MCYESAPATQAALAAIVRRMLSSDVTLALHCVGADTCREARGCVRAVQDRRVASQQRIRLTCCATRLLAELRLTAARKSIQSSTPSRCASKRSVDMCGGSEAEAEVCSTKGRDCGCTSPRMGRPPPRHPHAGRGSSHRRWQRLRAWQGEAWALTGATRPAPPPRALFVSCGAQIQLAGSKSVRRGSAAGLPAKAPRAPMGPFCCARA